MYEAGAKRSRTQVVEGRMKPRFQSLWMLAALATGCTTVGQAPPPVAPVAPRAVDALGPGDVVQIRVFREKDLEGSYRVSDDGTIVFPLIGTVKLVGRMPEQVSEEIRGRLADGYLVDPQVSVFVAERKSQKVHVLGQVNKAGTFSWEAGMNVVQAITQAGGFTKLASQNSVTVTRIGPTGDKVTFNVKVGDIGSGRETNFALNPGDIVFVPEAIF